MDCELCGRPVEGKRFLVILEGVRMYVCRSCYNKLAKRKTVKTGEPSITPRPQQVQKMYKPAKRSPKPMPRRYIGELEVVPDYAQRIKKARERLGWSLQVLAQKVGEKESVLRRIEAGRLTPTIDLARKLENILKIKLLEPIVEGGEEFYYTSSKPKTGELTLGDIVTIRKRRK